MVIVSRVFLLICLLLSCVSASAAPILSLEPQSQPAVPAGEQIAFDLIISGLGGPGESPSLGGYQISIDYLPNLVYVDTIFGDPLLGDQLSVTGAGSAQVAIPFPEGLFLFGLSFETPQDVVTFQAPAFRIAQLIFTVGVEGPTTVNPVNVILADEIGNPIDAEIRGALIGIPEPGTALSLLGGLACLPLLRVWRRGRK